MLPIHLPNFAPIRVPARASSETMRTPLGTWELNFSANGGNYELRAVPVGKRLGEGPHILITLPAAALRDYMGHLRALRTKGIVVGDEHGLSEVIDGADWSGAEWAAGDEVGGFFDSLWKGAKSVLKSKAFRTIGAIASSDVGKKLLASIPGIGAAAPYIGPTMTTLSSAATMLDEAKGKAGPAKARIAKRNIISLKAAARANKPRARAALGAVLAVAKARKLGGHSVDALKFLPFETRRQLIEDNAPRVEDVMPSHEVDAYAPLAWPGVDGEMPPLIADGDEAGAVPRPFRFGRPAYGYSLFA